MTVQLFTATTPERRYPSAIALTGLLLVAGIALRIAGFGGEPATVLVGVGGGTGAVLVADELTKLFAAHRLHLSGLARRVVARG